MMMTRASEKCSCGAEIEVSAQWGSDVKNRLSEWREGHRHESEGVPERESSADALVENSGPSGPPEMQIGFSRNWEEFGGRK